MSGVHGQTMSMWICSARCCSGLPLNVVCWLVGILLLLFLCVVLFLHLFVCLGVMCCASYKVFVNKINLYLKHTIVISIGS